MSIQPAITMDIVKEVSPALAQYTDEAIVNNVWKRPGLSPRDRAIATLSALITRQQTIGLPHYLNLALDHGVTPQEISGLITHLAFYASWSNAFSALVVVREIFQQRQIPLDSMPLASAPPLALNESIERERAKVVAETFGGFFPGVVQYTEEVVFRDLWLRPELCARDRSLVTVSALIASGHVAQLTYHLNRGMDNGLTETEVAEVVTHLIFYVGWPSTFAAMPVIKGILEERRQS